MKKLYWIFALILLFFVGDRLAGLVLKQMVNKSQFRYSRLYQGTAKSDILLVGNSRGLIFYQPHIEEITKKKTFNISYNGLPFNLAKVLVEDYYERYGAPETMLLDVTMCDRENPQLISGFNLYTPYSYRLDTLMLGTAKNVAYGGKLSHLYRNNGEVFQRAMFYLGRNDEDWLLDRVITDNLIKDVIKEDTVSFKLHFAKELNELVQFAEAQGTNVQLVINPYFPPFAEKINNIPAFKSEIEKLTGKIVHNYSKAVTDYKGFGDYQHLNKDGSRAFLNKIQQDRLLE